MHGYESQYRKIEGCVLELPKAQSGQDMHILGPFHNFTPCVIM